MMAKSKAPEFAPVTIELTFETQDEINVFYSIMNYAHTCQYTRNYGGSDITGVIRKVCEPSVNVATRVPVPQQ